MSQHRITMEQAFLKSYFPESYFPTENASREEREENRNALIEAIESESFRNNIEEMPAEDDMIERHGGLRTKHQLNAMSHSSCSLCNK